MMNLTAWQGEFPVIGIMMILHPTHDKIGAEENSFHLCLKRSEQSSFKNAISLHIQKHSNIWKQFVLQIFAGDSPFFIEGCIKVVKGRSYGFTR